MRGMFSLQMMGKSMPIKNMLSIPIGFKPLLAMNLQIEGQETFRTSFLHETGAIAAPPFEIIRSMRSII